ncbi:MAG: MipA/OmpV family protein, partial [Parvularculaceae bacterium]|nr:MipA/OmpV family protein [Parvularculaceae bacterium]
MAHRMFKAAAGALAALWTGGAVAQQHIDEPRLDPIFGRTQPKPQSVSSVENVPDNRFDEDGFPRFTRPTGLVGVMTFLTPDTTNLSIGLGPVYKPDYFGSNDFEWSIDPAAYVRFQKFLFLDDNGADFALFGFSNFSFGPTLRVVGPRKEEDNKDLLGLGDVGTTVELGGF